MKQRTLVGLGLVALGMVVLGTSRRKARADRWTVGDWAEHGWPGGTPAEEALWRHGRVELEAAPVVKLRGAYNDVSVVRGEGTRLVVDVPDSGDGHAGVFARRVDDEDGGPAVLVDVQPRRRVELSVPSGTAVHLMVSKSRIEVEGIDDVDVSSAKSDIALHDVAGTVRIRSAKDHLDVALAAERETRAVDVALAKSSLELGVPAARGGAFRIRAAKSHVTAPPSTEGGIPVKLLAAKSNVVVRAA